MEKRSLLLLGSQITTGGAQRALLSMGEWFASRGDQVTAAFLYDKDGLQARWQQESSFQVIDLKARAGPLALSGGMARLYRVLRAGHYDSIITFTHHSNLVGIPVAWLAGVPVRVATHHGRIRGFPGWLERLHAWLVNSRLVSAFTTISQATYAEAMQEGIHPAKISIIPNGVDLLERDPIAGASVRAELGVPEGAALVLSVGRLELEKGHVDLIDALPGILARCPETILALAGSGSQRSLLDARAHSLGVEGQVRFLGARHDVTRLLQAAQVFVLPSHAEGQSIALLEAMSAGVPVVAAQVGGVTEIVSDGQNGLLVPAHSPDRIAAAVIRLLSDPALGARLAISGRELVETRYQGPVQFQRYRDLIRSLSPREEESRE